MNKNKRITSNPTSTTIHSFTLRALEVNPHSLDFLITAILGIKPGMVFSPRHSENVRSLYG